MDKQQAQAMRNGAFHCCDNCVIDAPQLRR